MWADVLKRPFIMVGMLTLVLLMPLALTSTNAMVRYLGGKRWQWLHRLTYVIVPLGVLHFWWVKAGKNLLAQPILFAVIVGVLLLTRLLSHKNRQRPPRSQRQAVQGKFMKTVGTSAAYLMPDRAYRAAALSAPGVLAAMPSSASARCDSM